MLSGLMGVHALQSSRDKDKIRRIRAEIAEQHESIMELISECAIRFKGIPSTAVRKYGHVFLSREAPGGRHSLAHGESRGGARSRRNGAPSGAT